MNYRLINISTVGYSGCWYAIPQEIVDKYHLDDTTWEDNEPPEGAIWVADDEDEAYRVFALHLYLGDWGAPILSHRGNLFEVNRRLVRHGPTPVEVTRRVAKLREALGLIKPKTNSLGRFIVDQDGFDMPAFRGNHDPFTHEWVTADKMSLQDLKTIGYAFLSTWLNIDAVDEIGSVDLGIIKDAMFLLIEAADSTPYARMLRQAWTQPDIPVDDLRRQDATSDGEYLVVTDEEADELWDQDLENYLDDCMDIPPNIQPYFDRERWKRDARMDGRGHSLSSYDGVEHMENHDDLPETYYIYRTN